MGREAEGLLYLLNEVGHVLVIDTNTNTLIETIKVGTTPFNLEFDPTHKRLYVNNLDENTVSVIDTNSNTVIETITVDDRPIDIAFDHIHQRMYVSTSIGTVSVIDT